MRLHIFLWSIVENLPISSTFVPLFRIFHIINLKLPVALHSKRCLTSSKSKNYEFCEPNKYLPTPQNMYTKIFFRVFWSKVTIAYIFHHFHYFEPFRASFYIFPYNWPWTASLPAFKTLLNSAQLEKNKIFTDQTKILLTRRNFTIFLNFCRKSQMFIYFHHFPLFRALLCHFFDFSI